MKITRKTIEFDEDFLRQKSSNVDFKNDDYLKWIKILEDYCSSNIVYALAPVQIGIPKRIIYIKNPNKNMQNNYLKKINKKHIYINPIILSAKGKTIFLEGCASCIYKKNEKIIHYTALVERPYILYIEYFNIKGIKKRKKLKGFEATIFCHEYDHLNGIFHMDRSSKIFEMTFKEMKDYRLNHPYQILDKKSINNEI